MRNKWLAMLTCIVILALPVATGLAEAPVILPWGMSWDTSVQEYVGLLQTNCSGAEYRILETSPGGEYIVDSEEATKDWTISYRTLFQGEKTSERIMEHQLQDVEDKNLKTEWMCVTYAPTSGKTVEDLESANGMDKFLARYEQFSKLYGQGTAEDSYVETNAGDMKKKYTLPYQNGSIDFDAIWEHQRNYISSMGNLDSYWLVIGNGHASCRLYVSCGDDGESTKQKAWS